ncbi:MAG TPA: HAMP domain-containing sensor histidine kinase [Flavobacteriaceae bacterium]|nr:HAMP domain-containing sensor histidine kinase [Flavobacteriaceae bacterium]
MIYRIFNNRWVTFGIAFIICALVFWHANKFFHELKENETSKMQIWAAAQQELQQMDIDSENLSPTAFNVLLSNNTTPMLLYNHDNDTYEVQNIPNRKTNSRKKLDELRSQFNSENTPIEVRVENELLQTLYYGSSPLLKKLKYYPILLILVFILFFIALYFFYKTTMSSEQNKLWAGMAKETAHQIGTPLSSLIAWIEILKSESINPEYVQEMEKDITRLTTITERFSKIGSLPDLKRTDIVSETKKNLEYLKKRNSKLISYHLDLPDIPVFVNLNSELYSWSLENLIKNSIDAMRGKGDVYISIKENAKEVSLTIRDTGKGIPKRMQKTVFSPGYTTKKRGWGLGLSLSKRIIEEYHRGKIRVLNSSPNGTTMEIILQIDKKG